MFSRFFFIILISILFGVPLQTNASNEITTLKYLVLKHEIYSWPMSIEKHPEFFGEFTKYSYKNQQVSVPSEILLASNETTLPFEVSTVSGVNRAAIEQWLRDKMASEIERKTQALVIYQGENGDIHFQGTGLEGIQIDYPKTVAAIEKAMRENIREVRISTKKTSAPLQILSPELTELGIREILSTGISDFTNSTQNRIKNITIGAQKMDGILIEPDQIFSFNEHLGPVTGAEGYTRELIIRGNRAVPDWGGGLCQVSTTVFRGALLAGLPIVERAAHSYAVDYYEPFGSDATIYPGTHDFQFKNNSKHHILLHSFMENEKLYFTFLGTKDQRTVNFTEPEYSRYIAPPKTEQITSTKLAPGRKRILNTPHYGFDAVWLRFVTQPGQEKSTDYFRSRYKSTPKVELIGI